MTLKRIALIAGLALVILVGIACWRLYSFALGSHWAYRDAMAQEWADLADNYAGSARTWRARLDALPDDALRAPIWAEVRANPAIGVTEPFSPDHIVRGPWTGPQATMFLDVLAEYVTGLGAVPAAALEKAAGRLGDFEEYVALTPLERAVDSRHMQWPDILGTIETMLDKWPELDWAVDEIHHGVARRIFAPIDLFPIDVYTRGGSDWGPWRDVALLVTARGFIALERNDLARAAQSAETLYRLANLMEADAAMNWWPVTQIEILRFHADILLQHVVSILPADELDDVYTRFAPLMEPRRTWGSYPASIRFAAAYEIAIREHMAFDERLSIHGLYGAADQLAHAVEAGTIETTIQDINASLPQFAYNTFYLIDDYKKGLDMRGLSMTAPDAFAAAIKLRRYRERYGSYPERLDLIADIEWPMDPITGVPLEYAVEADGFLLRNTHLALPRVYGFRQGVRSDLRTVWRTYPRMVSFLPGQDGAQHGLEDTGHPQESEVSGVRSVDRGK